MMLSRIQARMRYIAVQVLLEALVTRVSGCCSCCYGCEPTDCQDWLHIGHTKSSEYLIKPCGSPNGYKVYCDMDTDGGGWTVFQRREDGSQDFYQNWNAYERGFGNISSEHWLGLIPIKRILLQGQYDLRIDLEDYGEERRYAQYSLFAIGKSYEKYRLEIGGYSGDAGDSLYSHNGHNFSTQDEDNDASSDIHCAQRNKGAWWYKNCHKSNLNGYYYPHSATENQNVDGIHWRAWMKNGKEMTYSMKKVEMKIRKV